MNAFSLDYAMNMLIGYDVRLSAEDYVDKFWDAQRRAAYLLFRDVRWPLSVDRLVWPSVFRYDDDTSWVVSVGSLSGIRIIPGGFRHDVLKLWQDPFPMQAEFRQRGARGRGIPLAVSLVSSSMGSIADPWSEILSGTEAPVPCPETWSLAGYDIGDQWMVSGLSNCGYEAYEVDLLRREWSLKLNEFGLFSDLANALAFADLSDRRVPEHAPFYTYSLHVGPAISGQT